jgi:hypothetical protein
MQKQIIRFSRAAQILRKPTSHLEILGSRRVTSSKLHTEDPVVLGATVINQDSRATWRPGLKHSCCEVYSLVPLDILESWLQTPLGSYASSSSLLCYPVEAQTLRRVGLSSKDSYRAFTRNRNPNLEWPTLSSSLSHAHRHLPKTSTHKSSYGRKTQRPRPQIAPPKRDVCQMLRCMIFSVIFLVFNLMMAHSITGRNM